jgi:uncharacterized hydrophobic protein (TIGR00271 family)
MMCFLLFDLSQQEIVKHQLLPMLRDVELTPVAFKQSALPNWPENARVLLYLSDEQITYVLPHAAALNWQLSFLPHMNALNACRGYGVSPRLSQAVKDGLEGDSFNVDLMLCNDRPVLSSVVIGDVFGLRPGGAIDSFWDKCRYLLTAWQQVDKLVPKRYELVTANNEKLVTAAMGITVVEHGSNSVIGRRFLPGSKVNDGMLHAILLAPRSLMEMFRIIVTSLFRRGGGSIPNSVGLIKTSQLRVQASNGMEYRQDGIAMCARELVLQNQPRSLKVIPGSLMSLEMASGTSKEQRKIHHLPAGEAISELTKRPLGWIAHAATEEFKDLYQALRENAAPSSVFLTLMILSTLLASVGLFADSPPVIIGAMILAPLMGPIISLAMAIARQDETLLRGSLSTLFTGLMLALGFAVMASWLIPLELPTSEITARLRPNLLDLAVAVISGIAGAYAHARAAVAKSLAGVAIAVALVPPLAVTGIGIGWGDPTIVWGAFLLFLTNLAGIVLAAAITFLVLGFAPFKRAKRGLLLSTVAVILVSVPLALSFSQMVRNKSLLVQLEGRVIDDVRLANIRLNSTKPMTVSLQLIAPYPLAPEELVGIKEEIEQVVGGPIILEAATSLRME